MPSFSRRQVLRASAAGALASAGLDRALSAKASAGATITTRMFWTWDHSTEWALNRPGAQTMGASNPYYRTPDAFLEDYTRLLQWCGRHHVDAVVVWGLLRDVHGGVEAAKKLCDVANRSGVRLLCGVGLNAYGGVYYSGDSPYSLQRHLEAHPDLYGIDAAGKKMIFNFGLVGPIPTHHACPSRKENQDFTAESLRWLFKTLPLGGVQMETGDTGVCRCKLCQERRQHITGSISWEDMALMYPIAADAIRSVSRDAWIVCETYSHPEPFEGKRDQAPTFGDGRPSWADACLSRFPKDVFVTWVCDDYVKPKLTHPWTDAGTVLRTGEAGLRPGGAVTRDGRKNIMRAHFSTYWGRIRGEPAFDWIADMVQRSIAHGFEGISLFGEVSPFHTGAELNYLALEHYGSAANPKADPDLFVRQIAAPLLGGPENARDYLRYARLVDQRDKIPSALKEIYARCAALPPEPALRWVWLANYLASFSYA